MKSFIVNKISSAFSFKNVNWKSANQITEFIHPWEIQENNGLIIKVAWDHEYIYFRYEVLEHNILVYERNNDKTEVESSERVEIFLRKNKEMNPYYCIEIDANGRMLDYEANHYRKFNFDWEWPKGHLLSEVEKNDSGYTVQLRISLASLRDLGLLINDTLEIGLYRGKCNSIEGGIADLSWISWVDPKTNSPDFHVDSSFGQFILDPTQ